MRTDQGEKMNVGDRVVVDYASDKNDGRHGIITAAGGPTFFEPTRQTVRVWSVTLDDETKMDVFPEERLRLE